MKGKPAPAGHFNVNTAALSKLMRQAKPGDRMHMETYHRQLEVEFKASTVLPSVEPAGIALGIYELVDDATRRLMLTDDGRRVKCTRGCSACCHVHVTITQPEAALAVMAASETDWPIDLQRASIQAKASNDNEWQQVPPEQRRCIFLTPAGLCSIYEHRPSACRRYFVVNDPADCDSLSKPGHEVQQCVSAVAEIVGSAALEAFDSGTLAAMILAELDTEGEV